MNSINATGTSVTCCSTGIGVSAGINVFDRVVSVFFGLLLIYSAVPHLTNPYYFLGTVYSYKLVGPFVGSLVAIYFPFFQIVVAACLILRIFPLAAHIFVFCMFGSFFALHTISFVNGIESYCGCFGPHDDSLIGRNSFLLTGAAIPISVLWFIVSTIKIRKLGAAE